MQQSPSYIIYDASAGSGKTFTLVRNYISRLLLSPDITAYKNLLALTFTNKAVAEMKSRILESLEGFSIDPLPIAQRDLFREVQHKTGLEPDKIRKKSGKILNHILHNYAAFEVSTIDSFTHRILRTFAKDLNIPINFEVQLDTEEILQEAVDRVIAKAGKPDQKTLTKAMIDFAISKTDDDRSWDISFDLNNIAKLLVNDNHLYYLEKLADKSPQDFADYTNDLYKDIKNLQELCKIKAEEFFELIGTNGLEPEHFSRKSIPNYFQKLQDQKFKNLPPVKKPNWALNIDNPDFEGHYTKKQIPEVKNTIDQLLPQIAQLYFDTEKAIAQIVLNKEIVKVNPSLSLLAAIQQEVKAIKTERNLLLISDFNKRIHESIKDEPVPFIYERLGDKYHTYYIDEFQDTSVLQWQNIIPLVANSLATEKGQLTLVGDTKQSIYRWRGGKAEQFMALIDGENPFNISSYHEKLPANYRSQYEIVNFNNKFFEHCSQFLQHLPYQELFKKAGQKPSKSEGGYVEINFIEAADKEEKNEVYPEKVFEIISRLTTRGHTFKEICILVRKKDEGIVIADFLNQHEIPIISSETLLLKKSKEVNFLIALLAFSINPKGKNIKFELLNYLYDHLNAEETTFNFIYPKLELDGQEFLDSLNPYDIHFSLDKLQFSPFYDAIEYSLRAFNLLKSPDAYIQFFLDFVYDFTEKHTGGITEFLDLWELKKDKLSITIPEGGNAVQIMTIHKAKGLEFPILIYPFANEQLDDTRQDKIWIELDESTNKIPITYLGASKKLSNLGKNAAGAYQKLLRYNELDAMNVIYVALTRAEKQLYILSNYDAKKDKKEKTNQLNGLLISFLKKEGYWEENKLTYNFGDLPVPPMREADEVTENNLYLSDFISSAPEEHSIEIITKTGLIWGTVQERALEEGKLIHNILQKIYLTADLKKVTEQAVLDGDILQKDLDSYRQKLKKIVLHPDLMPYFFSEYDIYTEKEILINSEFKRLDRLCIRGKKATIIDYKTGGFAANHERQIDTYAAALKNFGYEIQDKILVYIDDQIKLHRVS